ncbi:hypothetical protein A2U01_0109503, partial [Trifolium medium]|nr:hypothetical protein [Trifolium medium]
TRGVGTLEDASSSSRNAAREEQKVETLKVIAFSYIYSLYTGTAPASPRDTPLTI